LGTWKKNPPDIELIISTSTVRLTGIGYFFDYKVYSVEKISNNDNASYPDGYKLLAVIVDASESFYIDVGEYLTFYLSPDRKKLSQDNLRIFTKQ